MKLSVRPYSVNGQLVNTMEVFQIVELGHREFCLEMSDQGPRLRRDHKYYAQVQGEMALITCSWCDFVVWTAANRSNCFIEIIYFNEVFVSNMLPKLVEFFNLYRVIPLNALLVQLYFLLNYYLL